ncbi:hypothetical protein ACFP2F_03835 [Hymenobacter artigasi]|uniref:Uncharacterized protein n=1 Tax=Hymenobacter artigasi TaxID=2719616 RepID=A0ABX1HET0_9BACT|nr:hypothetical protein [Hymenobacter artigasi]NKI88734.1 hypothetical protein [Hymenobacter artigasi]
MTTSAPTLLLRVAATWPLPGLGLLALPSGPTPHLAAYELHAAVAAEAVLPDGARHAATATVEEITRGAIPERGLLLEFGAAVDLPAGTEIWLVLPPLPGLDG